MPYVFNPFTSNFDYTADAVTPGGSSGQLQYNNAGAFGGTARISYADSGNIITITEGAAGDVSFKLKGATSKSGSFIDMRNSSDTTLTAFDASGRLSFAGAFGGIVLDAVGGVYQGRKDVSNQIGYVGYTAHYCITTGNNGRIGFSTQACGADIRQCDIGFARNAAGIVECMTVPGTWASFRCGAYSSSTIASIVKGTTSQSASIEEWWDVSNNVLASISAAGKLTATGANITKALTEAVATLTDGATPALDASLGNIFVLVAAGDRTIAVPSNATPGQKIVIRHNASGGSRTLALNSGAGGFRFGSDITALTATASGKTDYIACIYNSTDSFWDVVSYIKGF